MNKKGAILLLMIYGAILMRPAMPVLLFQSHQAYIAAAYCVQKGNPGNACQGACFLRKRLESQAHRTDLPPIVQQLEQELIFLEPDGSQGIPPSSHPARVACGQQDEPVVSQIHQGPLPPPPWRQPAHA